VTWRRSCAKVVAVSYAAYRALVDVFPEQKARFGARMTELGLDPSSMTQDVTTPAGIGHVAAAALLAFRHEDGWNQHGTLSPTGLPYSDYTGYIPVNSPDVIADPNRWQPLRYRNRSGSAIVEQICLGAHWHLGWSRTMRCADADFVQMNGVGSSFQRARNASMCRLSDLRLSRLVRRTELRVRMLKKLST
jgi:hypothetical protein